MVVVEVGDIIQNHLGAEVEVLRVEQRGAALVISGKFVADEVRFATALVEMAAPEKVVHDWLPDVNLGWVDVGGQRRACICGYLPIDASYTEAHQTVCDIVDKLRAGGRAVDRAEGVVHIVRRGRHEIL